MPVPFPLLRDYLYAAAIALGIGLFIWWSAHERGVQAEKDRMASIKAVAQHQIQVDHEQTALNNQAAAAKADREKLESDYAEYRRTHPLPPVWVHHDGGSGQDPRQVATARPGDLATSAGPDSGGSVCAGSPGPATDISPELDTVVQSFGRLASLYRELQEQPQVK